MMFQKILIANRGEIACRIIKTAKRMGILTVAVYSEADAEALHVELADEAVCIGPAPARESYLVMQNIIDACQATGAQAIHPGYGFLSENEEFARRVEEQGLIFIGPKHHSIAAMGDKIASKKLAIEAQVNTIPGHNAAIANAAQAVEIAQQITYPVMIKASAGGGGKGLRVAYNDQEALEGFTSCQNEARNSFGDDRIFIEKFVEDPRHIEIQILGDSFGNLVYLWERECSIQRRHQKVIEEAPSAFISETTRQAMGAQAIALARAVHYQSAGTVEFVVGRDQSFYFLEMNTRLQVEHPVTEMITGIDIVEQMIRVAAGEKLSFTQKDIVLKGWAMECRINAEDPYRQFLPSTGRLVKYLPPEPLAGVRVDTGVGQGGEIPVFYDSLIAKLITHGADRAQAIAKMQEALNQFVIRGIDTNIAFQSSLLQQADFQAGNITTGFIAQHYPQGFFGAHCDAPTTTLLCAVAVAMHLGFEARARHISGQLPGHAAPQTDQFTVAIGLNGQQEYREIAVLQHGSPLELVMDDQRLLVQSDWTPGNPLFRAQVQDQAQAHHIVVQVERQATFYQLQYNGINFRALVLSRSQAPLQKLMPFKAPPDMSQFLLSPMPGLLTELAVVIGQKVTVGQKLAVIEAMKMENVLLAQQAGVVAEILATQGESLSVNQLIIRFEKG